MFDVRALVGNYVAIIPAAVSELDRALKSQRPDEVRESIYRAKELLEQLRELSSAALADIILTGQ
jgi:hypothetical protein